MENVVFGQSVLGFNRTQVLEYIDTLAKQLKEQETEYTNQQQRLQEEIESLSSACAENNKELALTAEKIEQLSTEVEYFKNSNAELKMQIDRYRSLIIAKDGEMVSLKKDFAAIADKCENLTKENAYWQERQNQISACLVEANVKAEQIIKQAQNQAEEKRKAMEENVSGLTNDVASLKDEISKVEKQLEDSFSKLQKAMNDMDASALAIEQQVNTYKAKVSYIDSDNFTAEPKPEVKRINPQETPQAKQFIKPVKKSLTDTVLETISKILE